MRLIDWIRKQLGVHSPSAAMQKRAKEEIVPLFYMILGRYAQIFNQVEQGPPKAEKE